MSTDKPVKPNILVDVYGNKPPKAAESFGGRGAQTIDEIKQAADARRNARPGEYDHKR